MKPPELQVEIVIVNRNYPPRAGVTGEAACKFAEHLNSHGSFKIHVMTTSSNYQGGASLLEPTGTVREIRSLYDGKNKFLRLLSSFIESYFLLRAAKSIDPHHIIVMTDPPFLQFWASLLLSGKQPWTLWAMDIFPDAFVAGNLVSTKNFAYRLIRYLTYKKPPNSLIALGTLQAKYLQTAYGDSLRKVIVIPCGVYSKKDSPAPPPNWKNECEQKIVIGYCGNLGEAHSVTFLKEVINHLDPNRFHLVLSVYGVRAAEILTFAETKKAGITFLPRVERDQMHLIDIHLVSLLKNWKHVCVPSKAVSAICSGSPILFYGTSDCDNWKMLGSAGWLIQQSSDAEAVAKSVKEFLNGVNADDIQTKKTNAAKLAAELQDEIAAGYDETTRLLTGENQAEK